MKLAEVPIRRPVATLMLLLSLTVLGGVAVFLLPLDFMPMVEEPEVDITVPYPGSHPLELLEEVVRPIEEEVATIPDVKGMFSRMEPGSATVEVQFDWNVAIDIKKMEVREAVERARERLPEEIGYIRVEGMVGGPAGGAILQGRISAERDLAESWDLLDRRIKRPLERIRGVARVDLYGVEPQQVRIDLDLDALRRHGVNAGDVISLVNEANQDVDIGAIHGDVLRYDVRTVTRFQDVEEIRNLRLPAGDGLRVRDVARVEMREPRLDYGRHLDRRFAIGIDVFKDPTANTVATVDRLMERIAEIERDPQLTGIKLLVWENAGEEIRSALARLRNAGIYGGILAVFVLYFFLRRVSTTLIVAVAIPFSLLVTCGCMFALRTEFNVLTLLGLMIGVGMLVDNAVVVIENIYRYQGMGLPPREAAAAGARQVALAVLASTATTVIVWSWLFVAERNHMVIYMGAVALTICLAVACSLLISLTFIPLAAASFVPHREVRPGFVLRRLVPVYRTALRWTLRHRILTLTALFLLAASVVIPLQRIEKVGEPRMKTRAVPVMVRVHDPATKEVMEGHVNTVEAWLYSRRDELGFDSVYSWYTEHGFSMTSVYLPADQASPRAIEQLRRRLNEGLPVIPGATVEVGDRDQWRRHGPAGVRVSVALHGEDPEFLEELAVAVEARVRDIPDADDVWGPSVQGQKEVRLEVDTDAARAVGVDPQAIARSVSFAFRGRELRRFQGPEGEVRMILGLPEDAQPGLDALADLPVQSAHGGVVPLSSAAEVTVARTRPRIQREDRKTTQWVVVVFDDEAVTTEEAQARVAERMEGFVTPEGYSWDWGWWGRDRDEGLNTMLNGVVLSLMAVILLMAALFESFTQPFAILVTLLLAFFGAFWALWLFGFELDLVAFMGVIILIGIVVNNGIVMVDHVNSLRRDGTERVEALIEGCGDRLRPVLMTAITTIFGLIPLAVSGASVANVYVHSIAVGVIGGLATSTVFTLLALPVWYTALEDFGSFVRRALPRRPEGAGRVRLPEGSVLSGGGEG